MLPIEEMQKLRKKLGLTQKQLAARAGVSQSLIAKIEAGNLDPTFTRAKRIFDALEDLREQGELKAKDIMHKKVYAVQMNDSLKEVIKEMKLKGISQVPVMLRDKVVGFVTEGTILKSIIDNPEKINRLKAGDVMEDAPPIIAPKTGIKIISELLRDYPAILVAEKGELKGIISKADLLGKI